MIRTIAFASAVFVASPALSQAAQPTPAAAPAKPKIICEKQDQLGSRLGGLKVCHTKEEWDALRAEARRDLEQNQRMSTSTGRPAG
jgi:hypothetical protein